MPESATSFATPSPTPSASDPSWRAPILDAFASVSARLSAAFDPDGMLSEVHLARALHQRGVILLPADDPAKFRHRVESEYRLRWAAGQDLRVTAVIVRPSAKPPYDFVRSTQPLTFSVKTLFPRFWPSVIGALDRADLDALAMADRRHVPASLDEDGTADFVLRHVFNVTPERLRAPVDLLHFLLRQHYVERGLPDPLGRRLLAWCEECRLCADWPLARIISDRMEFFAFLQERWEDYVRRIAGYRLPPETGTPVPFDHDRVRSYWDSLFHEGCLRPAVHLYRPANAPSWMRAGLQIQTPDSPADRHRAQLRRWEGLLFALESCWPAPDARLSDLIRFHRLWIDWTALSEDFSESQETEAKGDDTGSWPASAKGDDARFLIHLPEANDREWRGRRQVELTTRWERTWGQWLAFHEPALPFFTAPFLTFAKNDLMPSGCSMHLNVDSHNQGVY